MADDRVPDAGLDHPEASDGAAFNGAVGEGVAEAILGLVAAQAGTKTICDLGCGNGHLAGRLGRLGFSVLGIDASETYIEYARNRHASDRVAFLTRLIDSELARQLRSSHHPFDLVVSSDVIEHLYDPLTFVQAAFALLRPGGTAIIGTPYHGYLKNVAISVTGKWDSHHGARWHGGHIKFFSVASLRGMMMESGFGEPQFSFYGRFPGFWKNMIAVAKKPAGDVA